MKRTRNIADEVFEDFAKLPAISDVPHWHCYEAYNLWLWNTFNWLDTIHSNPDEIEDIRYLFIAVCHWWGNHFESTLNEHYLEKMGVNLDV